MDAQDQARERSLPGSALVCATFSSHQVDVEGHYLTNQASFT
jgi:hypothetical protein